MRFVWPLLLLACVPAARAHDIPRDVTVHAFLRPDGNRLRLLVRVPLEAMRDIDFPERDRGYLDAGKLAPQLPDAATVWIANFVTILEEGARLPKPKVAATQLSLESDRSFTSFEEALRHVTGPRLTANVFWSQALFDVLLEYPIHSDRSAFAIRPGFERLAARVVTELRFLPPGGAVRAYEFVGDPGTVVLDPNWLQAALRFVRSGFAHILDGTDHLLFLLCLVIPVRRLRSLIPVVTAFTVAHSTTLIASAYDLAPNALWFSPLVETLIAVSVVYMALENICRPSAGKRRWMVAFGFGLVHGFGFSFALRDTLQFAGSHLLVSLASFNLGVEAGQIFVLLLMVPALNAFFRFAVAERTGSIVLSALVAHTAWHWMLERADRLRRFHLEWPAWNYLTLATAFRWLAVLLIFAAAVRLWRAARRTRAAIPPPIEASAPKTPA